MGWVLIAVGVAVILGSQIYRATAETPPDASGSSRAGAVAGLLVVVLVGLALIVRGVRNVRSRGQIEVGRDARVLAMLFGVIVVAAGAFAVANALGEDDSWSTPAGRDLRAGFVAGCTGPGVTAAACECVFDELSGTEAYDTPEKFVTMMGPLSAEGDASLARIPPEVFTAMQTCAGG